MKLYFFVSAKDESEEYLESEVRRRGIPYEFIYFRDLVVEKGILVNSLTNSGITCKKEDRIIIRLPWVSGINILDYDIFIHYLASFYPKNIALDRNVFVNHGAFYEDKLFQSFLFQDIGVSYPQTFFESSRSKLKKKVEIYPVVAKKRVSTRSRGNFEIKNHKDLNAFFKRESLTDFLIQKRIDAIADLRVLILNGKIIGAISRTMHVREGGRLAVKGAQQFPKLARVIQKDCLKVAKSLGGNFVGVDVVLDKAGQHYIIEANISPQFSRFEKVTGSKVAKLVIQTVLGQS